MKALRTSLLVLILFSLTTIICYGQTTDEDYYERGMDYATAGKFEEAHREFAKAFEVHPFYVPAGICLKLSEDAVKQRIKTETALYLFKGVAHVNKGEDDEAIVEFKKALAINPDYAEAHTGLGLAYFDKKMFDEAIAEYKKALAINPDYAEAHFDLGLAYLGKDMLDEASAEFKRALEINPNLAETRDYLLQWCAFMAGECYFSGAYDEAIAGYKKVLAINPNHPLLHELHDGLGLAYAAKEMYDEAIAEYKRALEINPNYAEAHEGLGLAYAAKGMYDEAIAECKKALEIDPDLAEAHNSLAASYYYKREYSLAIKHCDRAIELGFRVDPKLLESLEPYRGK